jgi:hypothetical protein
MLHDDEPRLETQLRLEALQRAVHVYGQTLGAEYTPTQIVEAADEFLTFLQGGAK